MWSIMLVPHIFTHTLLQLSYITDCTIGCPLLSYRPTVFFLLLTVCHQGRNQDLELGGQKYKQKTASSLGEYSSHDLKRLYSY